MNFRSVSKVLFTTLFLFTSTFFTSNVIHSETAQAIKLKANEVSSFTIKTPELIEVASLPELKKLFDENDYDLNKVLTTDSNVPRAYLANFPSDLRKVKDANQKKELFIHMLLPMILHANEVILQERKHLLELKKAVDAGKPLKHHEEYWLQKICEKYQVKKVDFDILLRRVDIIPPSLALGQAIIESGWGLSYAALKKNSPFGMTPRPLQVKAYNSLYDSVAGYMLNLNRNNAYKKMRQTRQKLRTEGKDPDGHTLIGDMLAYSEQEHVYIKKVRLAIKQNSLDKYDSCQLEPNKSQA